MSPVELAEINLDVCRREETAAQNDCRTVHPRFVARARARLRECQQATVAAERALTAALNEVAA